MTHIAERYARAVSSSHLEVKVEPGDIDMVIAAGTVKESLGTGLLRLRAEFDSISKLPGARLMTTKLKSAGAVRARLIELIQTRAGRTPCPGIFDGFGVEMSARILDNWLSPECPTCTGRGVVGEYGKPQLVCTACGGSKRRSLLWSAEEEAVANRTLREMEVIVETTLRRIQRLLRT